MKPWSHNIILFIGAAAITSVLKFQSTRTCMIVYLFNEVVKVQSQW